MTAFFQSPFLSALGWALANSLWQMALLWLLFQLCFGINKKVTPRMTYLGALVFMLGGFIWFGITFAQQYSATSSINQYLASLPQLDEPLGAATNVSGAFSLGALVTLGEKYLPYLSASYLIILVILFIRLANAYGYSQEVKTRGLIKIDYNWRIFVKDFANRIGIRREVAIYLSELIDVPATLGWLKPIILLPVATFAHLSPAQVEAIILHELSHIRRNDYLVNLLISVVETILFFNPFCQLLASTIRKERENCCDDFVIQLRCDPSSYAAALLSLEKMRVSKQQQLAIAATGNKNQLLGRVKRILNVKSKRFNYGQKITALMLTAFILSSLAWLSPDDPAKPAKEKQDQVVSLRDNANAESSPLLAARSAMNQQNVLKRKMATLLPKNKSNFSPFERELAVADLDHALTEPGFFSYQVPDSFSAFSKVFFKKEGFKMNPPEWDGSLFFSAPNPVQEAWAQANRAHAENGRQAEYPRVYFNMPPGSYDLKKIKEDSSFMNSYMFSQDMYSNQDWNLAAEQLQIKLGELGIETENLSKDQADLIQSILDIQALQNKIKEEIILAPSEDDVKKFQRDSINYRFEYHFNTDNRKLRSMNAESLQKMKKLSERQVAEMKKHLATMQTQSLGFADAWNQKAKIAQEENHRMADRARAMQYYEFLQRVNPSHGEYQEKSETQQRMYRQGIQRKSKAAAENEDQEYLKAYRDKVKSLEDSQRMFELQQKRNVERQKELEDQMQKQKKDAAEKNTVLDLKDDYKINAGNQSVIFTSSSNPEITKAVKLVFSLNSNCVEPAGQNIIPVILTVKGIQKTVDAKTETKPKPKPRLQAIDL